MSVSVNIVTSFAKRPLILLAGVTLGLLLPFITKAFHVDDALFLWAAQHIQTDPLDFYGFMTNWYGYTMPMAAITQNPPLASYYIALVASLTGWQEVGLHAAFGLPALGASLGTFVLARHFCRQATLATLVAVLTPAFLVSATNVMADVMLLCFYIWAIAAWIHGLEQNRMSLCMGASVLITLAMLTKYFGVSLVPLLLAYSFFIKRRPGWWIAPLLIPLIVMGGYQLFAWQMYGRGLLDGAAAYALAKGIGGSDLAVRLTTVLAFSGGTLASAFIFMPLVWPRRFLGPALGVSILVGGTLFFLVVQERLPLFGGRQVTAGQLVQLILCVLAGVHIMILAADDLASNRDGKALLLFLWVAGVFFFAGFVNWSVNARALLPMAPALGILAVRRLERNSGIDRPLNRRSGLGGALLLAASVALAVAWADYTLAESQRDAAARLHAAYGHRLKTTWFQGHWGFQYYMQRFGFRPVDFGAPGMQRGDIVVTPTNNSNAKLLSTQTARLEKTLALGTCRWLTTMQMTRGAGFYAHQWGPLPFVFGAVPGESYLLYEIK